MRFNGVELKTVHHALSISKEIPPGMPARDIVTVETSAGGLVASVTTQPDEYRVIVNIAARTHEEAESAREALAAWAMSSGKEAAELEPTNMPGKAYTAILKSAGRLEQRFGTVDVVFMLTDPVLHEVTERRKSDTNVQTMTMRTGGTAPAQINITYTANTDVNGLTMAIDGAVFFAFRTSYTLPAGAELNVNMHTGAVTVDGVHAENMTDYTRCDYDRELEPGEHTLTASAAGDMTARWHNKWL